MLYRLITVFIFLFLATVVSLGQAGRDFDAVVLAREGADGGDLLGQVLEAGEDREGVVRGLGLRSLLVGRLLMVWEADFFDPELEERRARIWAGMADGSLGFGSLVDVADLRGLNDEYWTRVDEAFPGGADWGSAKGVLGYQRVLWVEGPDGAVMPIPLSGEQDIHRRDWALVGGLVGAERMGEVHREGSGEAAGLPLVFDYVAFSDEWELERWEATSQLARFLDEKRRGARELRVGAFEAFLSRLASSDPRLAPGSDLLNEKERAHIERIVGQTSGWAGNWRLVSTEVLPSIVVRTPGSAQMTANGTFRTEHMHHLPLRPPLRAEERRSALRGGRSGSS